MAIIEFVDYVLPEPKEAEAAEEKQNASPRREEAPRKGRFSCTGQPRLRPGSEAWRERPAS